MSYANVCIYSKHVTRLNLVKYGWQQGMKAIIAVHDTRKQEDAIRMNRQHVHICESMCEGILVYRVQMCNHICM